MHRKRHKFDMAYDQLKLDNQLCFRLYAASRLMTGAYYPYLDPLDLTYPQYLVLMVLWEQDKQPVCDIAKRLFLETNTVTPLLQRMEKAGLITRAKGEVDTRQRIVSLTDKGRAMQKKAVDIHESMRNDMALKSGEEEEIFQMVPAIDKLIEKLSKLNK